MEFLPIIGVEVHIELKTKSKMFCGCSADYFGQKPNSHCCPVCLGLPGALPVPNKQAIEWCIQIGQALKCKIPLYSQFDRKNYFYPDLPKGYQISQMYHPFAIKGYLKIKTKTLLKNDSTKTNINLLIRINRVHMEEDTGKMIHQKINNRDCTLIDFNRSGVPLVEIVTEPDFHAASEVKEYLKELQLIIRYLGVSEADMEKGSMRCEPNISLLPNDSINNSQHKKSKISNLPDYKVEIKNINSFKYVEDAINYEIERQENLLKKGEKILQETRRWDENKKITYTQRSKEEAKDYRYFPEPDIPPFFWTQKYLNELRKKIPILPQQKRKIYQRLNLPEKDIEILISDMTKALLVDKTIQIRPNNIGIMEIVNAVVNERIVVGKIQPAELIEFLLKNKSSKIKDPKILEKIISEVIRENPNVIADYLKGKKQAFSFLMGQIMKKTKGSADPKTATEILLAKLQSLS